MVRDKDFRELIALTAKQTGVHIADVERAVEFYFKTTATLIEWDRPVTIHMNYIGDFVYNEKHAAKVKQIIEKARNGAATIKV